MASAGDGLSIYSQTLQSMTFRMLVSMSDGFFDSVGSF